MALATITSKGQITIPKSVRDHLKLKAGDKIDIIIAEKNQVIFRPVSKKVDDLFGKLHRLDRKSVSVDGMNKVIKQKIEDTFNESS